MIIAVGSTNPVKLKAVKLAFNKVWPDKKWLIKGLKVDSTVSSQPKSNKETVKGAKNRAKKAIGKMKADFGVGLEGGIEKVESEYFTRGWCVVVSKTGEMGIGSSVSVHVPKIFLRYLKSGHELGLVNDLITGKKQTAKNEGHFGIMTKFHLTRTRGYTDAVIVALSRFLNPQFYQ